MNFFWILIYRFKTTDLSALRGLVKFFPMIKHKSFGRAVFNAGFKSSLFNFLRFKKYFFQKKFFSVFVDSYSFLMFWYYWRWFIFRQNTDFLINIYDFLYFLIIFFLIHIIFDGVLSYESKQTIIRRHKSKLFLF